MSTDINKELLNGFIDESIDSLNTVDSLFIRFEQSPSNLEIVNEIFRPVHSLKGNAAFFGLMKLKKLAHTIEEILDIIRKGHLSADKTIIDHLLPGIDLLRTILSSVRNGDPEISDTVTYETIIRNIDALLRSTTGAVKNNNILQIQQHINKLHQMIPADAQEELDKLTSILFTHPSFAYQPQQQTNSLQVSEHNLSSIDMLKNLLSQDLPPLDKSRIADLDKCFNLLYAELSDIHARRILDEIVDIFNAFTNSDTGLDALGIELITEKIPYLIPTGAADSLQTETKSSKSSKDAVSDTSPHKNKSEKTMRIPEMALDEFLYNVGELLGVEEMLKNLSRQVNASIENAALSASIKDTIEHFEGISRELRTKIMEVRKVEARVLLQKTHRIVRDIASSSGKSIDVECSGENIRIDKSYIDLLDAPLTHMVRNAADHGIESPDKRIAVNKNPTGKISVKLLEDADYLLLIITDDGQGLNIDGLRQKAIDVGIIDKNAQLTKSEIVDLLFYSGVSTAQTVTDISGRGVGMDVVKKAVVDAGGKIEVSSVKGEGTTFTISIPRNASTQIIDGYIVRSFTDETYVLPLGNVIEAFSISNDEITEVAGIGNVITRRELVLPVFSLNKLLDPANKASTPVNKQHMGVLVEVKGRKSVLQVKEIEGIQKIVCKQIEGKLMNSELFDGAAIAGSGNVSMIINIDSLLDSA